MAGTIDWAAAAKLPIEELERLLEADSDEIDEGLEASPDEVARARPGTRRPGQRGPGKRPAKVLMTLRVELSTLVAWRATGPGWQGRVNAVLADAARRLPKA